MASQVQDFVTLIFHAAALMTCVLGTSVQVPLYRLTTVAQLATERLDRYYVVVNVGTPAVPYQMCVDFADTDTWLTSTRCRSASCSQVATKYNGNASTTFVATGTSPITISVVVDRVKGYTAEESFSLGEPPLVVRNQPFAILMELPESFFLSPCDGQLMIKQNLLAEPLYALWLDPNPNASPAGTISFGGTDPSKYTGSIQYFRGSTGDVWTVPLKEIRVGGRSVPLKSKIAMLGPEQNFIAIPEVMAKRLFEDIPGVRYDEKNNIYNITGGCKDVSSLPDISFLIGDQLFIMSPQYWTTTVAFSESGRQMVQTAAELGDADPSHFQWACISVFREFGAVSIDGREVDLPMLLGAPFVRAFYTVYRRDGPGQGSVGIAPKAE